MAMPRAATADVEVDVIVVAYESAATIESCIASIDVAAGSARVTVVDNGSRDESVAIARRCGARVLASGGNVGFAAACNLGARETGAAYVAFLNPDARLETGALVRTVQYLREHADVGIAGLALHDDQGLPVRRARRRPTLPRLFLETFFGWSGERTIAATLDAVEAEWVPGSAIVLPRAVYERVGGMDGSFFLYFEDIDLGDRIRAAGLRVLSLLDPMYGVGHDESGHVKYHDRLKIYAWHRACLRYFEKQGCRPALVRALLAARALLRLAFWSLAIVVGATAREPARKRLRGYVDFLRFVLGRGRPLPNELSGAAT